MENSDLHFQRTVDVPSSLDKSGLSIFGKIQMDDYDQYSCDWHFNVDDGDSTTPKQVGGEAGIQTNGYDPIEANQFAEMVSQIPGKNAGPADFQPDDQSLPNKVTLNTGVETDAVNKFETLNKNWKPGAQ
jgi:hypothetical protein